ncbi:MAG: PilW family protein [Gallionella sp.]|nr:PilW family protein [Gallionella sp.]
MNHPAMLTRHQTGLSLVELMISLTIGLLLMTGITTLIVQQSNIRDELEKSSRQIENGRYAIQLLHDDIQLAGFFGEYAPPSVGTVYTTPDPCVITGNLGWSSSTVPVAIYGYAGVESDPTTCGLENYKPGTAILVLRRTSTDTLAAAAAVAGTTYLQVSRCNTATSAFVLGASGFTLQQKDCATLAPLRKYSVRIYFISSCDVCGTDTIPTLKMLEFADGVRTTYPLVEGIENIQYDFGIDNTADGSPDNYLASPAEADWQDVMSVRVNLLARNNEPTNGYVDNKSYQLGTLAIPAAADSYRRHAYSELVRAINPSGRRE